MPAALAGIRLAGGDRPVRDEAAEVVDARDVCELEYAPEPLDPPAVALAPHLPPVVGRLAPELPVGMRDVGRRSGNEILGEQIGVRVDIGAVFGDVDGDVADQPHAAIRGVTAERMPLPL